MAVLPDINALGGLPSGLSGRVHPNYDAVVAPGRGHAEGFERLGEGYRQLGRGISNLGDGITSFGQRLEREQEAAQAKQNKLAAAQADARFLTDRLALDNELAQTGDYQEAYKFGERYQSALNNAAQYIQDPQAQAEYLTRHSESLIRSNDKIIDRANTLYKNNYIAGLNETMDGLAKAGMNTQDPTERARIIQHGGEFMDDAVKNGIIDAQHAYNIKEKFTHDFAYSSLEPLKPEAILRAVRPVSYDAAANQAMSFFMSKGWTEAQAAGIVGNLAHESGGRFNPNARNPGDGADGSDSIGIGQWNSQRARNLMAFAEKRGAQWNDFGTQLEFVQHELETSEAGAAQRLRGAGDVTSSTEAFLGWERPKHWEGGISTAHGGYSRLNYAKQFLSHHAGRGGEDADNQKIASLLPPEQIDKLEKQALRNLESENQAKGEQHRQFVSSVKQQIQADVASIHSSGKEVDGLTPDMVEQALGPEQRRKFEIEREVGKDYFVATSDWSSLPRDQIVQRLDSIKPANIDANDEASVMRAKYYKEAMTKAKAIIKLREEDPAAAVDDLPAVKAAKQDVDLGGGVEAQRRLVDERMKAFDQISIPANRRIPVTKAEAQNIVAPVYNSLPGTEFAAMEEVSKSVADTYGPDMGKTILAYGMNAGRIRLETKEAMAALFLKYAKGGQVSPSDVKDVEDKATQDAITNAIDPRPDYGNSTTPEGEIAQRQIQADREADAAYRRQSVPKDQDTAIRALIADPSEKTIMQFNEAFNGGRPGRAEKIIRDYERMTKTKIMPEKQQEMSPMVNHYGGRGLGQ